MMTALSASTIYLVPQITPYLLFRENKWSTLRASQNSKLIQLVEHTKQALQSQRHRAENEIQEVRSRYT